MKVTGDAIRLGVFLVVTSLLAVFLCLLVSDTQIGHPTQNYRALLTDASYLKAGDPVRIAGVDIGKVAAVQLQPNATVLVTFNAQTSNALPVGVHADIRYKNLIGDRYLELTQGAGPNATIPANATIPLTQTAPAVDLDQLIGGFQPLFQALNPALVNKVSYEIIQVFQGESGDLQTLLSTVASATSTLADRDAVIGDLITNLRSTMHTLASSHDELSSDITRLQQLISGLADDRDPIGNSITHLNQLTAQAGSLIGQARPAVKDDIGQLQKLTSLLYGSRGEFNRVVSELPELYIRIGQIAQRGNFFNFYICNLRVKIDGPNGAPIYTPWVDSSQPNCADKPTGIKEGYGDAPPR